MPSTRKYRTRARHAPPIAAPGLNPKPPLGSTSLTSLPIEILNQIVGYLVPSDEVFRIEPPQPSDLSIEPSPIPGLPPHPSTQHRWFADPGTTTSQRLLPASFLPFPTEFPIHSLLLACSIFYDLTAQQLYLTNTFSFPDPDSAIRFSRQLFTRTRELVRFIHVDVCGGIVARERLARPLQTHLTSSRHISYRRYTFDHDVDARIVDVPPYFPNLWELRIGGIGPGVVKRDVYAGEVDTREDRNQWNHVAVAALARITGLTVGSSSAAVVPSPAAGKEHTLINGKVFLCPDPSEYDEDDDFQPSTSRYTETDETGHSKSFGALQVHGTRIISSTLTTHRIIEDLVGENWQTQEINLQDLLDRTEMSHQWSGEERQRNEEWEVKRAEILRRLEERKKRMSGRRAGNTGTWSLGTVWGLISGR